MSDTGASAPGPAQPPAESQTTPNRQHAQAAPAEGKEWWKIDMAKVLVVGFA